MRRLTVLPVLFLAFLLAVPANAQDGAETGPYQPTPYVQLEHPEWTKNATIYELNTRQFTEEGTFRAAQAELPRLKELGVDIVWLMPIHPIGEQNRKGTLGSPYSVRDYYGVNPEFGTMEDLEAFVDAAHDLGMHVILDWIANHTAWDNPLVAEHPDWYDRGPDGDFRPTPWWDWSDIIDLDYSKPEVRRYMTEAMAFWVREADIDGFRADAAGLVPLDFWEHVTDVLWDIKPVFMLAEWEGRDFHARAFNATYAWSLNAALHRIAVGDDDVNALYGYYAWNEGYFPANAMRMTHVSNHDQNSWEGTQFERFGDALAPAIVLSVVGDGIPMMYNGQEAGNERRLAFFEKDPIEWREHWVGDLYAQLFALHHENTALWNAKWGALMVKVPTSAPDEVLAFVRENEEDKVFAVFNFSDEAQTVTFEEPLFPGTYTEYFTDEAVTLDTDAELALEPWGYRVYVR